jgi:uncharacterized protein
MTVLESRGKRSLFASFLFHMQHTWQYAGSDGAATCAELHWLGMMSWKKTAMVAVKVEVGPSIMLHSGAWFDFGSPRTSDFTVEDIAHGLANICRYSGQCCRFYSVAEHSLLVSEVAEGFEFEALLHDAAEAFIGDITRPLKQMLPDFKRIEAAVQGAIMERFGVTSRLSPQIKDADLRVLAAEQRQIMPPGTDGWLAGLAIQPAPIVVRHLPPDVAKRMWLDRFEALRRSRIVKGQSQGGERR